MKTLLKYVAHNNAGESLYLQVEAGTDLYGTFKASCLDTGETLTVNGWLWSFEAI